MHQRATWPKITGAILALESVGLILWQARWWWWRAYVTHGHIMTVEWFFLALAVVFSALSYCVYRAHNWARRLVIALCFVAVGALIVSAAYTAIHEIGRIPEFAREVTPEVREQQILFAVSSLGVSLCVAAPFTLLICVLAHPDVARSFHPPTPNAI